MKDLDLRCKDCDRYLNLKGIRTFIGIVRCPSSSCKAQNQVKVVNSTSSEEDLRYKFPDTIEEKLEA